MTSAAPSYKRHRYPVEIIDHCVWLYFRFTLSFREVEEMMLARGVVVSYETIRRWCAKFGPATPASCVGVAPAPGTSGISTRCSSGSTAGSGMWRAVDQNGTVLDILISRVETQRPTRSSSQAPEGTALRAQGDRDRQVPSYTVAHREIMPSVEHRRSKYLNNRAEQSHQPTRARERAMKRFKSVGQAQRFLAAFGAISPHFRPRRHRLSAPEYRQVMAGRFGFGTRSPHRLRSRPES